MAMIPARKGAAVSVYDPNPGARKTVVFLHGWPLSHAMFEYQFAALRDCRCIGIDLHGFGKSAAPLEKYDYNSFADDLAAVVRQMNLQRFTLLGFSMGGAAALRYMSRYRGNGVSRLALVAAAAPVFTRREDFPFGMAKSQVDDMIYTALRSRPQLLESFAADFFGRDPGEPMRRWFRALCLAQSPAGTLGSLFALRDEDLRPDLGKVRVPTGIFHGKKDRICPFSLGVELNKSLPDSTLFAFQNSGHAVFYDELDAFNRALVGFIS